MSLTEPDDETTTMNYYFTLLFVSFFIVHAEGQYNRLPNVKVVTLLTPRSRLVNRNADGTLDGFIIELLSLIAPIARFRYTTALQPDGVYGSLRPNGTWRGIVGSLIAGDADIGAIDLTVTSVREPLIDFTSPFAQSPIRVLMNVADRFDYVHFLVNRGSPFEQVLRGSTAPAVQAIWADIVANDGLVSGARVAVDRVLAGGYAYIADQIALQPFITENPGKLRYNGTCDDIISNTYLAFGVQSGSPLRKQVSIAMSKINELGQLQSLLAKYGLV